MSKEEDENKSLWKGEASDELTSFFRSIFEYRLSVTQGGFIEQFWKRLMDDYIKDPSNGIAPNSKDQSSARGNFTKAFIDESMTWKTFKQGLKFLGVKNAEFQIQLNWKDGGNTVHNINILLMPKQQSKPTLLAPETKPSIFPKLNIMENLKKGLNSIINK